MKQKVGIPAVVIAVIALVGFMIWWGVRTFNPPDSHAASDGKKDAYLAAEAQKCQGDFSKLPADEQEKINKVCSGRGAQMIAGAWMQYTHTH